jgi:hypothetical protein
MRGWAAAAVAGLALVGLVSAAATPAPQGLPIVEKAIRHHGGSTFDRSRTELTLCSGSGCYEISVRMDSGLYTYRVAGPVSAGHREVEATNDTLRHWHEGVEQSIDPSRAQSLRDWAMARIYFVFLPYRLNDPGVRQQDLGLESWGGRELHKVKVTFRAGSSSDDQDEFLYWFDPGSGRLEQYAYSFEGSPGGLRFRRLSNYRDVGGILFYDQENLGVDADGLEIEQVAPDFVERRMRPISTVTVNRMRVEQLPENAGGS